MKNPLPIPRKSFRLDEIASRNTFSLGFIYKQIGLGLLRARKAGAATIVTAEDEQAWIEAMPTTLDPGPRRTRTASEPASMTKEISVSG
jgi:hypothetical protein